MLTPVFLLFKQALATGWDCPRAKILVKLRENMSETFEIQTLWSFKTYAESKHYGKDIWTAHIFTIFDEKYKLEVIKAGNGFETQRVFLKEEPKKIRLVKKQEILMAAILMSRLLETEFMSFLRKSIFPIQRLIM